MPTLAEWRTFYDAWAGKDPNVASTGERRADQELDAAAATLADWLQLSGREHVLDVGCASATLTGRWSARAARVVGVDFCAPLLDEARRRHGGGNLAFANAEARQLPFADRSFDRVCCFGVLPTLPDHDYAWRAVQELLRVLRPHGRLVLGGLPDVCRKGAFFDQLEARGPWYQRRIPRRWRWRVKALLRPGSRPGHTKILWYDIDRLAAALRDEDCEVEVHDDPAYAGYQGYRSSLIVTPAGRPTHGALEGDDTSAVHATGEACAAEQAPDANAVLQR